MERREHPAVQFKLAKMWARSRLLILTLHVQMLSSLVLRTQARLELVSMSPWPNRWQAMVVRNTSCPRRKSNPEKSRGYSNLTRSMIGRWEIYCQMSHVLQWMKEMACCMWNWPMQQDQ